MDLDYVWDIIDILTQMGGRRIWYSLTGKLYDIKRLYAQSYQEIYISLSIVPDTIYTGNLGLYVVYNGQLIIIHRPPVSIEVGIVTSSKMYVRSYILKKGNNIDPELASKLIELYNQWNVCSTILAMPR